MSDDEDELRGCEINRQDPGKDCGDYYNCCDCGYTGDGCGCGYCFSCNACDYCLKDDE